MSHQENRDTTSKSAVPMNKSETYSSNFKMEFDDSNPKSATNFEELFDSGYNSNVQSKTFIEMDESELDACISKVENVPKETKQSEKTIVPQWADSGVCITDSGLGIHDEDNFESNSLNASKCDINTKDNFSDENKDSLKIWLKQNSDGDTLLHLAIIEGLEDIACSIIKNTSSSTDMLNSYNYLYQTPLHLAVLKRQMSVVQLLIHRGVCLTFQDNLGNTAFHIACKYSLIDIVQLFLSTSHKSLTASKCFDIKNYDGNTCVQLAAFNNDTKLLEMLVLSGANINVQEGRSGKSVLHEAVENLNVQLVFFLIKKCNADVNLRTFANKTPLHLVWKIHLKSDSIITKSKTSKIIKLLLEHCNDSKISLENIGQSSESELSSDED